ncbi:hypothetical protein [Caulobacter sp. NIBR1757]|uniref:hypothetical protein n=1 Tax=Caulobacter sp. NIBR1757 TaxID=3016000 RepID=UPI0022F092FE|nr:hypothetical protein [Caulobacter sp. NIBR1757]WGM39151.1 hypothetical protein AMEJIAPC_02065 [Caulobacter sp. NIBR1757]
MDKTTTGQGRAARSRNQLFLAFAGAAAGLVLAFASLRMETSVITAIMAVVGFVVSVASMQASLRWWKEADEAVKEAHKTGWYWGGSGGLAVAGGLLGLLFAIEPDFSLRQFALFPGDAGLMATGLLIPVVLAFVGYTIAWAAWWLRNR